MSEVSKNNLFGTPKDYLELVEFINRMPAESQAEAHILMGLTWNYAVECCQTEERVNKK